MEKDSVKKRLKSFKMIKKSYFADIGSEIVIIMDENLPDDTNVMVKMKGSTAEFYVNPNRLFSTLSNKDTIIAGLNKKLTGLINDFKTKISIKKVDNSKFLDILIRDVVYDKLKGQDHVYLREVEEIVGSITRMLLFKKEVEEEKKMIERRQLEKMQEKIDNDGKKKK